jgi:hypothetical protein
MMNERCKNYRREKVKGEQTGENNSGRTALACK